MAQTMRAKIAPTLRESVALALALHSDARTDPGAEARLWMVRERVHPADYPPLSP